MGNKHLFRQPREEGFPYRVRFKPDRELVFPDIWQREDALMEANAGKRGTRK